MYIQNQQYLVISIWKLIIFWLLTIANDDNIVTEMPNEILSEQTSNL